MPWRCAGPAWAASRRSTPGRATRLCAPWWRSARRPPPLAAARRGAAGGVAPVHPQGGEELVADFVDRAVDYAGDVPEEAADRAAGPAGGLSGARAYRAYRPARGA